MIVIFQSESENKAIKRVERVLDAYANRIGRRSWITTITQDGLDAVHRELRRIATKDTSVSCLLVKGKYRTELEWIVGRRDRFDSNGNVPVNSTSTTKYLVNDEEEWMHLPLLSSLTAMAALWHDMGKSSDWFQSKLLDGGKTGDPRRHEWVSCVLLWAYIKSVGAATDKDWLNAMTEGSFDEEKTITIAKQLESEQFFGEAENFPVFLFVAWLILTHHRMPGARNDKNDCTKHKDKKTKTFDTIGVLFKKIIRAGQGYITAETSKENLDKVLSFSKGLPLFANKKWVKETSKWACRLCQNKEKIIEVDKDKSYYEILMLSRCALVMGDHYQSSLDGTASLKDKSLIANLKDKKPNQSLEEHILGVEHYALKTLNLIPALMRQLPKAYDIKLLKAKSPQKYKWQDRIQSSVMEVKGQTETDRLGGFIVDMASTGKGKTIANAKILSAFSNDESLRFSVLLGLRTLTLQTGEEYRKRLGLAKEDLSVIVGSKAYVELSKLQAGKESDKEGEEKSSDYGVDDVETDFVSESLPLSDIIRDSQAQKMLYPPVLVSTIDQVIQASEATAGAHNIIPILRILSSDVIIDEIDDYIGSDLIAVGRLIYLCGVFGRKVIISSATIPPEEIEGLASAYQRGWAEYAVLHRKKSQVLCMLTDEFNTNIYITDAYKETDKESLFRNCFRETLQKFIEKRVSKLKETCSPRIGEIVSIPRKTPEEFFKAITEDACLLHSRHAEIDPVTGRNVSFGLIRFSNIKQCILYSRYLDNIGLGEDIDIKLITYHAREVMLIRHKQEAYLDRILCRKNPEEIFNDKTIRNHIDNSNKKDIVFIVISSPVEELGRDHDFDWAVIEPASIRSIIQTSGRVLRHRDSNNRIPNIGILQYNWKAINNNNDICYCRPGFESTEYHTFLPSHDLYDLIDENELKEGITAVPRISYCDSEKITDFKSLEHIYTQKLMGEKKEPEAQNLAGFYGSPVMLTAISQRIHPFRQNKYGTIELSLFSEDGRLVFKEKTDKEWIEVTQSNGIKIEHEFSEKDWLPLSYEEIVSEVSNEMDIPIDIVQKKYGTICFPDYGASAAWKYSNKYGMEQKEK